MELQAKLDVERKDTSTIVDELQRLRARVKEVEEEAATARKDANAARHALAASSKDVADETRAELDAAWAAKLARVERECAAAKEQAKSSQAQLVAAMDALRMPPELDMLEGDMRVAQMQMDHREAAARWQEQEERYNGQIKELEARVGIIAASDASGRGNGVLDGRVAELGGLLRIADRRNEMLHEQLEEMRRDGGVMPKTGSGRRLSGKSSLWVSSTNGMDARTEIAIGDAKGAFGELKELLGFDDADTTVAWVHLVDSTRQMKMDLAEARISVADKEELLALAQAAEEQTRVDLGKSETSLRERDEKVELLEAIDRKSTVEMDNLRRRCKTAEEIIEAVEADKMLIQFLGREIRQLCKVLAGMVVGGEALRLEDLLLGEDGMARKSIDSNGDLNTETVDLKEIENEVRALKGHVMDRCMEDLGGECSANIM